MTVTAEEYPPPHHVLRDLRLTVEHRPDGSSSAWIPVTEPVCAAPGVPHAGVLATLVDVVGGGLAAITTEPDWIATADLTLHLLPRRVAGDVEALSRVLRRGRTTVVLEVSLTDTADGAPLGLATMSFAVLPRRDDNPVVDQADQVRRMGMGLPGSGFRFGEPFLDRIGLRVLDAAAGTVELPRSLYVCNTLGAIQGGMVATTAEQAARYALRAACGAPVETVDLQVTFLALARVGSVRSRTRVLAANPAYGTAHVELVDTSAGGRVTTIARVVAARPGDAA